MMRRIILILFFAASVFIANVSSADPIYLTTIPLDCNSIAEQLHKLGTPKGFNISVYQAHKLAMKASGIIKPCGSKLEQVIYIDNEYYYFTNSVLIGKLIFADKFVKVNGITGKAVSNF
jgi:hypothetical protein